MSKSSNALLGDRQQAEDIPLVEFRGVTKTYGGAVDAVKDLNLRIGKGEFLTLLGPSGSGKSTTLMMLAGFEMPSDGDILFEGRSIAEVPTYKRDFGMVFQQYALFPHMTVNENVAFALKVRKRPKSEISATVQRALEMVHLDKFGERRPNQLSGGQQQRVALARAMVYDPRLILMDEPLGALDKQLRERMQLEIKRLHTNLGLTVVYVTHDQSEALSMSDRVAIFDKGTIQQIASPSKLYEEPDSVFTACFLGESNIIPGSVVSLDGGSLCTVMTGDGHRISATVSAGVAIGSSVSVSVRPEQVSFDATSTEKLNNFPFQVEEWVYLGDCIRVIGRLAQGIQFMVKCPANGLPADLKAGAMATVSWPASMCRALAP